MGTIECSQPASKSSWDSQDFGDICMVLKMAHIWSPPGHDGLTNHWTKCYSIFLFNTFLYPITITPACRNRSLWLIDDRDKLIHDATYIIALEGLPSIDNL